ncbi:MAG TPA: small ribosomal subunit Rsm22 family protein [Patescibacteria group bacterium]|nr:small ribosomal subunit Rsm22 family protein [Patescibacteria group bacterium]
MAALRLRASLDRAIRPTSQLARDAEALSLAYRTGRTASARSFVHDERTAAAYAATRMPATFAAAGRAMLEGARSLPGFRPRSLVDIGAGTGSASWAAAAIWPGLQHVTLIDGEPTMIRVGRLLADGAEAPRPIAAAEWRVDRLGTADLPIADLLVAAYVLGELDPTMIAPVVESAWAATSGRGALVIVEPGSRAGFGRILAARDQLIAAGAVIAAPCPGNVACPVRGPAWCHFLARLDRSPLQRTAKAATRSWEDEPYSYLVAARPGPERSADPAGPAPRVVLGRPRHRPGRIELRVCAADGLTAPTIRRRDGGAWRVARDLAWGDRIDGDLALHLRTAGRPEADDEPAICPILDPAGDTA